MTKLMAYNRGLYMCEVPYVHHLWDENDWICWIDAHGKWTVKIIEESEPAK